MINYLSIPQFPTQEGPRSPPGAVGVERAPGSVPPSASPEIGPANPRLRIDRDLGMVVIEFRDSVGRLSLTLPSPREIEAYRASILFGAELPSDIKGLNRSPGAPSAARPSIPVSSETESPTKAPSGEGDGSGAALNKVA